MKVYKNKIGDLIHLDYKRATDKEYAHEIVYLNHVYIGYIMPNHSKYADIDENYNFVGTSGHPSFHAKTKDELINNIS